MSGEKVHREIFSEKFNFLNQFGRQTCPLINMVWVIPFGLCDYFVSKGRIFRIPSTHEDAPIVPPFGQPKPNGTRDTCWVRLANLLIFPFEVILVGYI